MESEAQDKGKANEFSNLTDRVLPAGAIIHYHGMPFYVVGPTTLRGTEGNFELAEIE